jgi:hypothetical protein
VPFVKSRCWFRPLVGRVKSESNQKSCAGVFGASMSIMGAAKVVRVHAKFASKPGVGGGRNQKLRCQQKMGRLVTSSRPERSRFYRRSGRVSVVKDWGKQRQKGDTISYNFYVTFLEVRHFEIKVGIVRPMGSLRPCKDPSYD